MPLRTLFPLLLASTLLTACGSAESSAPAQSTPEAPNAAVFPVTIKHKFGEVTIEKKPSRIVALGWNDLAVASALNADVVGAVKYFDPANPNLPYIKKKLGDDVLGLNASDVSLEKVASYEPDVILATSSNQLDAARYESLSKIAPVVAYEKSLYGSAMEDDAKLIGKALGEDAAARQLVDHANESVAKLKAELPKLQGKSYLYGQVRGSVLPLVVGKDNLSTRFMTSLGLKVPDAFANASTSGELAPGTIGISYEQASQLDSADVLFMTFAGATDKQTFETNPITKDLKVVKEGRFQATTLPVAQLLQGPNVAGVDWLLEQLKPTLQKIGA